MTDLTQRQLHDAILRSLKETGKRMAEKYKGAAYERPAAGARGRSRARSASKLREGADSKSPRRS